jgi:hypothetical protein
VKSISENCDLTPVLEERVRQQLAAVGNNRALVRSFFKHPSVAYISDA